MTAENLSQHLRDLEVTLHQPDVRSDMDRLDELLHDSFTEFGRSGRCYDKADVLNALPLKKSTGTIWSQDFSMAEVAEGIVLLTYRSAHLNTKGELSRHTLRSSLWQRMERGWQVRFHQGTPTDVFVQAAT